MPQMAPMNWILLYLMFSITFLLFNFINYYILMISPPSTEKKNFFLKIMSWKW
uniref:ATP synthase complex subunit 8 n=1 Tax=Pseudotetracha mendacia TaxID=346499 RepID=A0A343EYT7_9CARA|nr:ATP synthase F0 subunit 8 [Pseudotetracha mendacia]